MQFAELRYVCLEAAVDLARTEGRPLPPTVVLPGADRTRLLKLADFPEDDESRHAVMAQLAADEMAPADAPCWGFIAEAEAADGEDVVVVVYGARRHTPNLTASRFADDGQPEEFVPSEELDPTAMPFLHPLQHAADAVPSLDDPGSGGGLPIFGG